MSIKSSLEIALERTKDVKADRENLQASGFVTAGKKLVSQYLNDPEFSLARKVREHVGKERQWLSQGVFDALTSNLALPSDEYGLKRNRRAMEGFSAILRDQRRLRIMGQQIEQFFAEYFQERQQLKQNVDRQYAPRLQQKKRRWPAAPVTGCGLIPPPTRSTSSSCGQQMALLEDRYGNVLQQVKQELSSMFGPGGR